MNLFLFSCMLSIQMIEINGISSCSDTKITAAHVCIVDSKDPNDFSEFAFDLSTYIEVMDIGK